MGWAIDLYFIGLRLFLREGRLWFRIILCWDLFQFNLLDLLMAIFGHIDHLHWLCKMFISFLSGPFYLWLEFLFIPFLYLRRKNLRLRVGNGRMLQKSVIALYIVILKMRNLFIRHNIFVNALVLAGQFAFPQIDEIRIVRDNLICFNIFTYRQKYPP